VPVGGDFLSIVHRCRDETKHDICILVVCETSESPYSTSIDHWRSEMALEHGSRSADIMEMNFTPPAHCLQAMLDLCSSHSFHLMKSPKNSCCAAPSTAFTHTCLCAVNSSISGSGTRGNNRNHTNAGGKRREDWSSYLPSDLLILSCLQDQSQPLS
jgi:hypothetical protein